MKRNLTLLLFLCCTLLAAHADNGLRASEILNRVSGNLESSGTLVKYRLTLKRPSEPQQEFAGELKIKGEKFYLQSPEVAVWFNGKEQWSLSHGSEEVNLTEPTDEELQSVSPYFLLKNYADFYTCRLISEKGNRARIELIPKKESGEYERVTIEVDTQRNYPVQIIVNGRDKSVQEVSVLNYRNGLNFDDSLFVFDSRQHPGTEINDLR